MPPQKSRPHTEFPQPRRVSRTASARPTYDALATWALAACAIALPMLRMSPLTAGELQPLPYNHPGLHVDLGVGLWAWPVPADADGDGDYDLLVSCPDQPSNGVWLFENANGDTAANPLPVFRAGRRLSGTVHYVMPSYVGDQVRVLSPGFEYPNFLQSGLSERSTLPVPADFYRPRGAQPKGPKVRHNQWRYVDYDDDGRLDLIVGVEDWSDYGWDDAWNARGEWTNGPLHGFVFWFRNIGANDAPQYAEPQQLEAAGQAIDVYGCPSPNFGDFDGDGDLDLLCGEFLDGFTYFANVGTRSAPVYAAGRRLAAADGRRLQMELQMIVPVAFDWDRDGDLDLIVGDEDGRVAWIEHTGACDAAGAPIFRQPRYFQQEAATLKCGALATPAVADWDGDGDQDIVCGNTAGWLEWFENLSGPGVESPQWAAPVRLTVEGQPFRTLAGPAGSIQGPAEAKWGYTCLSLADWDHDGLIDVVFNDIWGKVQWLRNRGPRAAPRLAPPQPVAVAWPGPPPKPAWTWWTPEPGELVTQWRTTPVAVDWDGDRLTDLVLLDAEGYLTLWRRLPAAQGGALAPPERCFFADNLTAVDSRHRLVAGATGPLRLNAGQAGGSGRRKLAVADWDGDGALDLLVNSTSANWLRQTGSAGGQWTLHDEGPLVQESIQGHSTSPAACDFNGDGIVDLLIGAEDGRLYYLRNPRTVQSPGR